MHQSAMCAYDDQTFCPLTTKWPSRSSALVRNGGEVRPGARLREALAPDLLGGEDVREVALLLLVRAVRDDRRPGHAEADHCRRGPAPPRAPTPRSMIAWCEYERALTAVLLGPRDAGVARVVDLAAPGLLRVGVGQAVEPGVVLAEPGPDVGAEGGFLGRVAQLHA